MRFSADVLQQSLHQDLQHVIDVNAPSWSVDCTPLEVACYRQKESLLKKFNNELKPLPEACDTALRKFMAVNTRLSEWQLKLNHVCPDWELVSSLRSELASFLEPTDNGPWFDCLRSIFLRGGVGPGASIGAPACDFYSKVFGARMTSTASLSDVWSSLVGTHPQFRTVFDESACGCDPKVVDHNKLSFVNKNQDVARTICTEPSANMWMQLGLGSLIHDRLRSVYGIDFYGDKERNVPHQQEVNRRMTRLASSLDHLATFDLESASDSLGLRMMESIFPRNFVAMLYRLRSSQCLLPDGSRVTLNMVSTMGNGFTFPLQTLLFMACCAVCLRYAGLPVISKGSPYLRNVSVYGDDIIIDNRAAGLLRRLLTLLGFIVNESKSYVEGPFRESCGIDCFLGVDVRPVYVKRLRSLQDAFVVINKLNLWSAKTGVPLRNTVAYVLACFPRARRCHVPYDEADISGIKVPGNFTCKISRSVKGGFGLLKYTASVPSFFGYVVEPDTERIVNHPKLEAFIPSGMWYAFLGGYVTGSSPHRRQGGRGRIYRVSLRQEEVRYITKRRVTPRWDYLPPDVLSDFHDRTARLANACWANLS